MPIFTIRPFSRPNATEHPFRINLSPSSLLQLKLQAGDLCHLSHDDQVVGSAIAWPSTEKIQDSVIQTSRFLQDLYALKLGDKVSIQRDEKKLSTALLVTVHEVRSSQEALEVDEKAFWEQYLRKYLPKEHEALARGQLLELGLGHERRTFEVDSHDLVDTRLARISKDTRVVISTAPSSSPTSPGHLLFDSSGIGGLSRQIHELQCMLRSLDPLVKSSIKLLSFWSPDQGILLYGPKGTGKSLMIGAIARCRWAQVIRVSADKVESAISSRLQPRLVIVSNVGSTSTRSSAEGWPASVPKLLSLFDSIRGQAAMVIAEVRHPNDVHESLRGPGLFEREIEIPVPTAGDRGNILRAIRGSSNEPDDALIEIAASRTHGYVGADLFALLKAAARRAEERTDSDADSGEMNGGHDNELTGQGSEEDLSVLKIRSEDLNSALSTIRPTALQEVFLETPDIRWSDIGGQHAVKQRLQEAVEWPLKYADRMKRLNLEPNKGVLLYGPPGCSKTLLVKALATEAGLNFLAVKGAELISMYVGESERAVRDLFRKARAASPSIIFFDEVDSIASSRKSELNVLTTLLNEMDGFEELKNVFVVAATNKPHAIDPALLRPGRLDNVVYVGLPDVDTRREILDLWLKKSSVKKVDVVQLADLTDGYSGAEIVRICRTAAETAMRADRDYIDMTDLEEAVCNMPFGITPKMLQEYSDWNTSRR